MKYAPQPMKESPWGDLKSLGGASNRSVFIASLVHIFCAFLSAILSGFLMFFITPMLGDNEQVSSSTGSVIISVFLISLSIVFCWRLIKMHQTLTFKTGYKLMFGWIMQISLALGYAYLMYWNIKLMGSL